MAMYKREGIPGAIKEQRKRVSETWRRHRNVQRLIEDHWLDQWEDIRHCGLIPKVKQNRDTGLYKVTFNSCHKVPFCIRCAKRKTWIRTQATLNRFNACTPKGKEARLVHIVQVVPVYDDGTGWGVKASQNLGAFGKLVWGVLQEAFGDGIGAVMSYQDYGERCFAKRNPHLDLTLNGWSIQDDGHRKTGDYTFAGPGRQRWADMVTRRAQAFELGAGDGIIWIGKPRIGIKNYAGTLKYQMRELVDFSKLEYSRGKKKIWWMSYKDQRREQFTVNQFMAGFAEYQWRLGAWAQDDDGPDRQKLHRSYGHIAERTWTKTMRTVGGNEIPHGKNCPCGECGDWDRVFLDEVESFHRGIPYTYDRD